MAAKSKGQGCVCRLSIPVQLSLIPENKKTRPPIKSTYRLLSKGKTQSYKSAMVAQVAMAGAHLFRSSRTTCLVPPSRATFQPEGQIQAEHCHLAVAAVVVWGWLQGRSYHRSAVKNLWLPKPVSRLRRLPKRRCTRRILLLFHRQLIATRRKRSRE